MKPIYFPYTFVPTEIVEAGAACFGQIVVYHPTGLELPPHMIESEKKGLLQIRVPMKGDEDRIRSVVKNYRRWADVYKDVDGIRLALSIHQESPIPFFNESSILKIREDIQRKINKVNTAQKAPDPHFSSRVFLHMAHEFDMQNYDVNYGIRNLNNCERELMKNLHGDGIVFGKNDTGEEALDTSGTYGFMVAKRIEAWSGLMLQEQKQQEPAGLFVTSHRSVFTHLMENFSEIEMVLDLKNILINGTDKEEMKGWRASLMRQIQKFAKDPWPIKIDKMSHVPDRKGKGRKASLKLYVVPGINPFDFFVQFYPHKTDDLYTHDDDQKITNTLLGFFELDS